MSYNKIINQYFVDNFSENVICLFRQGLVTDSLDVGKCYRHMQTGSTYDVDTELDRFFIRFAIFGQSTENASIGTRDNIRKRQPISVTFNLYTPSGESNSKEISMESILDDVFLNIQFKDSDNHIYADTATPKTTAKVESTGNDVWNDKVITYRLVYEYF